MENITNVTTGKVRLSYVHLFKPYAHMQGQEEKFSCTVLVPKTDTETMTRINTAIEAAKQKGITDKWNGQCPPLLPTPVHDGDGVRPSDGTAFGPECKGHWVFTASAKADYPPEVVGPDRSPIMNQSEVYSGIYAYVNVNFFPYSFGGKKGIGCGLGPVMKVADGEPLSGESVSAAQAFANVPQPTAAPQAGYGQAQPPIQQPAATQQTGYWYTQNQAQPQAAYSNVQPTGNSYPGQPAAGINPITGLPF